MYLPVFVRAPKPFVAIYEQWHAISSGFNSSVLPESEHRRLSTSSSDPGETLMPILPLSNSENGDEGGEVGGTRCGDNFDAAHVRRRYEQNTCG